MQVTPTSPFRTAPITLEQPDTAAPAVEWPNALVGPASAPADDWLRCPISGLRLANPVMLRPMGGGDSRSAVSYDPRSLEFARAAGLTHDPIHNRPLAADNVVPARGLRELLTAVGETPALDGEVQLRAQAFTADWLSNNALLHERAEQRLRPWRQNMLIADQMLHSRVFIASLRRGAVGAAPQLAEVRDRALTCTALCQLLTEPHRAWLARRAGDIVATWQDCLPRVQQQWPMGGIIPVSMPRVMKLLQVMGTAARALETTSEAAVSFMVRAYIRHNLEQDTDLQAPFTLVAGQAFYQLHQQQMLSGVVDFPYEGTPSRGPFLSMMSPLNSSESAYEGDLDSLDECDFEPMDY